MAGPSGATARLALPYPVPDDTADVPRDVKALADKLDPLTATQASVDLITPGYATTLPVSPFDGQEVYLQVDGNGVVWHLRYRAANPTTYKWEFIGGGPLTAEIAASTTAGGNTLWQNIGGPGVTVPRAGVYQIAGGCFIATDSLQYTGGRMAVALGAAAASDAEVLAHANTPTTGFAQVISSSEIVRTMTAAGEIRAWYKSMLAGAGIAFSERRLSVLPVRVS